MLGGTTKTLPSYSMAIVVGVLWLAIWCWSEMKNLYVNLLDGVKYPNMETTYNFAIYETPEKYSIFSVKGDKKKYNMISNELRKCGYWFTVSYTPSKKMGDVLDVGA